MRLLTIALGCSFALLGCSGGDDSPAAATTTGGDQLAPPDVGMQIASTDLTLKAGGEQYTCWSYQVTEDKDLNLVAVNQVVPVAGVHHFAIFTNSGALPKEGLNAPYECSNMGPTWGLVEGGGIGTPGVSFPEGTSMKIKAGTQIVLQLHLLNTQTTDVDIPPALVNLVGDDSDKPFQAVGLLIAGTLQIALPPDKKTDINGGCAAPEDMKNIFQVFPHMHKLGHHIKAQLTPAGASATMLNDQDWDFGTQGVYPVSGAAVKGDQVGVTCSFNNTTSSEVDFGLGTEDEMCLEVLFYYPATKQSQYCGLE